MVIFCVLLFSKLFFYLPGVSQSVLQILLPLFILFALKFVFVNYLVKTVFLRDDSQRITNLAPYYVISYFSFFFDCFLGLVACVSRVWQTTIISLIRLPRLDKSMFNKEDDLLMRRLDKGHLAYLNYVRMEHWYNNPVLNGFCEMLIESMLYSQIYRAKYTAMASSCIISKKDSVDGIVGLMAIHQTKPLLQNQYSITRIITTQPSKEFHPRKFLKTRFQHRPVVTEAIEVLNTNNEINNENNYYNESDDTFDDVFEVNDDSMTNGLAADISKPNYDIKTGNSDFKFESFLRLRNIFYLCLMLKKNPSLRMYRRHYLEEIRKREAAQFHKVQTSSQFFSENLERLLIKIKAKNRASSSKKQLVQPYETSTTNTNANDTDDELNNETVNFTLGNKPNSNRNRMSRKNVYESDLIKSKRKRNSSH
jgi:hypothetical protein